MFFLIFIFRRSLILFPLKYKTLYGDKRENIISVKVLGGDFTDTHLKGGWQIPPRF